MKTAIISFIALSSIVFFTSSCTLNRGPSLEEFASADFGEYPSNILRIVKDYLKNNVGDSYVQRDVEIRKPKKHSFRSDGDTNIYYGYGTKVIIDDEEFFVVIRDNIVLAFTPWDSARHGSEQFDKLLTVETIVDDIDRGTIHRIQENEIGRSSKTDADVELNLQCSVKGKKILSELIVVYKGFGWLSIKPGESLIFLVDNERIAFATKGEVEHRVVRTSSGAHTLTEKVSYDITHEQLRKIVSASEVKIKLVGSDFSFGGFFTEDNFYNFRTFYDAYVDNAASEPQTEDK